MTLQTDTQTYALPLYKYIYIEAFHILNTSQYHITESLVEAENSGNYRKKPEVRSFAH